MNTASVLASVVVNAGYIEMTEPLTDAELDEIIADHVDCGWEGDDGCPHCKMARELRALRRHNQILAQTVVAFGETDVELREQNAKLVAALEEISIGKGSFALDPYYHAVNCITEMKALAEAALASVKGEQG